MKFGFRSKLFIGSVILILLAVFPSGFYLQRALQAWSEEQVALELERQAETLRVLLENSEELATSPRMLNALATRVSVASNSQIRIITAEGEFLANSTAGEPVTSSPRVLSGEERARWRALAAKKHPVAYRPGQPASLTRAWSSGPHKGWVQVSYTSEQLDATFSKLRLLMMFTAALGLALVLLVSWLATFLVGRMMYGLVEHTHRVARGASRTHALDPSPDAATPTRSITQLAAELARSVEDLARERDRFFTVLESMTEAVVALDDEQRIRLINRAAQEFFAPQLATFDGPVEGQRVTSLIKIPALLDLFEDIQPGKTSTSELTLPGPPQRRVMVHITPRPGKGGYLIVMHDVTELRQLERIRRDFVANVSHELRTPVSVIMLNSETLLADDELIGSSPHARRFIDGLHRNAERLSRLISDLLDISRLEAGRFRLELEPISVFGAALKVMDALEEKAERKGQELEVEIDVDLLVFADAKALDQMLFNFVDNAIKYAPEGGHILVTAARDTESVGEVERPFILIEVLDDGPGLSAKHRPRIFERFYRIDDGRSRDVGGTGLGLAIVKHLGLAMGGRVGVRPNEPVGSAFWMRLPEADAEDEPEIEVAQAVEVVPVDEE